MNKNTSYRRAQFATSLRQHKNTLLALKTYCWDSAKRSSVSFMTEFAAGVCRGQPHIVLLTQQT